MTPRVDGWWAAVGHDGAHERGRRARSRDFDAAVAHCVRPVHVPCAVIGDVGRPARVACALHRDGGPRITVWCARILDSSRVIASSAPPLDLHHGRVGVSCARVVVHALADDVWAGPKVLASVLFEDGGGLRDDGDERSADL